MEEITRERDLYTPVRDYLSLNFAGDLQRRAGAGKPEVFLDDVSTAAGTSDGIWTRPDIAAIAFTRGTYIPFLRADLHTFEVKTASGLDVKGVHEASAHRNLGHFSWLVFQSVGKAARSSEIYNRVLSSANTLGVGVLTFRNPSTPKGWYVDAWPRRTDTDDAVADMFIGERFNALKKQQIKEYLSRMQIIGAAE